MSVKPVFSFNNPSSDDVISPFWAKPQTKVNRFKRATKII
jgi:hypothetical protein